MQERRHAAIMFTDIIGYTALMGSDENQAFQMLQKNREIHRRFIKKFGGELIKEMGDGILASFQLASYAVRCAQAIQFESQKQVIPLKIGIHEGEIVFDGNDVFGDGVNIASRLQESAGEGYIYISGAVYQDVKNQSDIQTRFIGQKSFKNVEEPIKVFMANCNEDSLREFIQKKLEKKSIHRKSFYVRPLLKLSFVLVPIVAAFIIFLFYSGTSLPFTERDWIVITDFKNLTDDPIFDNSLNTAFTLSISQSRYINVISRQRLMDALKRMKTEDVQTIDEETGMEIAMREGVNLCIVPSISKVGTQYILTAKIQETEMGDILRSEVLYASNKNEILKRLDQLSKRIRRNLGESEYKILQQSKPLSKVTTSSLEALKEFTLGIRNHINLKFDEARIHYENAIRLDSNFTSAKASLGNLLVEKFDREEGIEWLNEAIMSIDNLTDSEKYGILAFYAVGVENDLDKGIEYTRLRVELYPDDPIPHNNLGWYYGNRGDYEKSIEESKTAVGIDPYLMIAYPKIIWTYLTYLGEMDSAMVWAEKMISYLPENAWGYYYLGSSYIGKDEYGQAVTAFIKGKELDPDVLWGVYRLAHVYRLQGSYEKAIDELEAILRNHPDETPAHYDLGINYNLMGARDLANSHFLEYKKTAETWLEEYPDNPEIFIYYGILLSHLGKPEAGWEIGKSAIELDSTIHYMYCQLLSVQGRKSEAFDQLEKALENGYRDLVMIKINPDLQSLKGDPRFDEILSHYFDLSSRVSPNKRTSPK